MGFCVAYALFVDFGFGMAYLAATLPLLFGVLIGGRMLRSYGQVIMTMMAIVLWSFFLIRPLFLVSHPEFFKFILLYSIDMRLQIATLLQLAIFNGIVIAVLGVLLRTVGHVPARRIFRAEEMTKSVTSLTPLFLATGTVYLAVSLLAVVSPDFGGKILSLSELVLPVSFLSVYAIALLVLRFDIEISRDTVVLAIAIVATYMLSQLFQGSKSFLLELAFIGIFAMLIFKGDVVISMKKLFRYSGFALIIFVSFPVAMAVRRISSETGFSGLSLGDISSRIQFMAAGVNYESVSIFIVDLFTKRLNGYDGLIAALQIAPDAAPDELSVAVMFANAMAAIVPGLQSSHDSFGTITSRMFYPFLSEENDHGGAIGSFGMLSLFARNSEMWSFVAVALYAAWIAAIMVFSARVKIPVPLRVSIVGALFTAQVIAVSGGNFDRSFRDLVATIFQATTVFYFMKVRFSFGN